MSKDNYDFSDLDAILAEFRGEDAVEPPIEAAPRQQRAPADSPFTFGAQPAPAEKPVSVYTASEAEPALPAEVSEAATIRFDPPTLEIAEPPQEEKPARRIRLKRAAPEPSAPAADTREDAAEPAPPAEKPRRFGRRADAEKPGERRVRAEKPPREYRKVRIPWILRALMSLVFLVFALAVIAWTGLNVHPASGTLSFSSADAKLRLSDKLDVYVNNAASDALGDLTYIKKIYTLQESDTVSPVPNPDGFGSTYDPAEVQAVIQKASILLDGQRMTFDVSADFVPDEPILYYFDDTILVVAWKEYIEQRCCTFAEVKIAHGSQLRRKLAEDSYSSSVQLYASDMAKASNAVVAMNGDFYAFRDLGITVYQRKLYRNNPAQVDSCFFTASGDMLFSRAGELMGEGEAEAFIQANDVVFAVAFGPILVDNGELQYCAGYPIGEVNTEYSRSCISMTDDLHYLLMTINHTPDARPRATINELARIIYSKNVRKAYTLDGGQTAEIIMMGGPINHVDFGEERAVSDIIYFATAIPEEVRS